MNKNDKFIRSDDNPGAILNTDNNALKSYKLMKQKEKKLQENISEVNSLKKEVSEIRSMLHLILERLK